MICSPVFNFFAQLARRTGKMESCQPKLKHTSPKTKISNITVTALKIVTGQAGGSFLKLRSPAAGILVGAKYSAVDLLTSLVT